MAKLPLTPDQEVQELDWEVYLRETAKQILAEQSPRRLLEVRGRLYELISHCIPPEVNYSLYYLFSIQLLKISQSVRILLVTLYIGPSAESVITLVT